jgi:hypothetical protein
MSNTPDSSPAQKIAATGRDYSLLASALIVPL